MASKAKSVMCRGCQTIVGYTHKDNPVPSVYCPACTTKIVGTL